MEWIVLAASSAFTLANSGVLYWLFARRQRELRASLKPVKQTMLDFASHLETYTDLSEKTIRREAANLSSELRRKAANA